MENKLQVIREQEIEACLIELRGQKVLLDRDVAILYGVETKRVNEAVRNNPDKFPEGYLVSLQVSEKQELVENFDRFKTLKHATMEPKAFTEKGLYMLATVLKSPRATDEGKQKTLTQRSSELLHELLSVEEKGDTTETESSIELNLYALKMKRTVKKTKKG